MTDAPQTPNTPSPQEMIIHQQFADQTLEEVTKAAEKDGMDPGILHTAYIVSSVSWLQQHFGPENTLNFLGQMMHAVEASAKAQAMGREPTEDQDN